MQKINDNFVPIGYCGRNLRPHEKNYSVSKLELLAVVFSITYFRTYLEGKKFTLFTDHAALTSVLGNKSLTPQLTRFALLLQSYDFDVVYVKGLLHEVPDSLSRRLYDYDETDIDIDIIDKFPDNQLLTGIPDTYHQCNKVPRTNKNNPIDVQASDENTKALIAKISTKLNKQNSRRTKTFIKQNDSSLHRNSLIGNTDLKVEFDRLYGRENTFPILSFKPILQSSLLLKALDLFPPNSKETLKLSPFIMSLNLMNLPSAPEKVLSILAAAKSVKSHCLIADNCF